MAKQYKILLLDFDEVQAEALCSFLQNLGDFEPLARDSGNINIKDNEFHIIVQSLTNGAIEIVDTEFSVPILLIESKKYKSKNNSTEKLNSPFRLQQFESKIRGILRQNELNNLQHLMIAGNKYVAAKRALVSVKGEELRLTDKEIEIISYLHKMRPRCVPREELLKEVWRYNEGVTTHTLETHIYRLRQKLSHLLGDVEVLITEEGGYKITDK